MVDLLTELCQNHNSSVNNLLDMASKAKLAGAKFAKIQALYTSELVCKVG